MRDRAALADKGTTLLRRPKTLIVALNFRESTTKDTVDHSDIHSDIPFLKY